MFELPVSFFLFDFFHDMIFVLKIFILLTVISFTVNHLGKGPLAIVIIMGFSYFMLFSPFSWFFQSVYVLMMLLMLGAAGILIDFFFVGGTGGGGGEASPVSSGADIAKRTAAAQRGKSVASAMVQRGRGR